MNKAFKKTVIGMAALTTSVLLAACGQQSTSSQSTHHVASSTPSAESESTKAYHSANQLIKQGNYKEAYNKLNNTDHQSTQVSNLSTDLHNYISAKDSYNNGNYDEAANSLSTPKSKSQPMHSAYNKLQTKISNAKKVASSSLSSSSASQSSSAVSSSSSSSSATSQSSVSVVNNFANKMGFNNNQGYSIIPRSQNGNDYEFEVRQNNSDNTVANMVGIYHYNDQTKTATKVQ